MVLLSSRTLDSLVWLRRPVGPWRPLEDRGPLFRTGSGLTLPHPHVKKPYAVAVGFLDVGVGEHQARTSSKLETSIFQGRNTPPAPPLH